MFRFLVILLLLGAVIGCRPKSNQSAAMLDDQNTTESETERRDQESFKRTLEVLQSMEDNPDLEGMPGHERMVQELDRMNKWIAHRKPDSKWQSDPAIDRLAALGQTAWEKTVAIEDILTALQGEGDVAAERQKLSPALDGAEKALAELGAASNLDLVHQMVRQLGAIRARFKNLDAQPNVTAGAVRAFVRQMETERRLLAAAVEALNIFAESMRTGDMQFQRGDMDYLKQCVWTRSISMWARGEKHGAIDRAKTLYDWTVRHVDLRAPVIQIDQQQRIPTPLQLPWQTLLLGSGTTRDRAWLFLELLRQQRIDGCLLGTRRNEQDQQPAYWGIGVLDEGEIYVFLLEEGVPLPGPQGPRIGPDGLLEFPDVATLSQMIENPAILERTVIGDSRPPFTPEILRRTAVAPPMTPQSLSMRMKLVEKELIGNQTMVLYTPPHEQRDRFSNIAGVVAIEPWTYPMQAMLETRLAPELVNAQMAPLRSVCLRAGPYFGEFSLWRGRIIYFQGRRNGAEGAADQYQLAMTPDRIIQERLAEYPPQLRPEAERGFRITNILAAYWLGLSAVQDAKWEPAREFFEEKCHLFGRSPWQNGIDYNLGRVEEAEKQYEKAIAHYRASGNMLRAEWLVRLTGKGSPIPAAAAPKPSADSAPPSSPPANVVE